MKKQKTLRPINWITIIQTALACLALGVIGLIVYVNILYWNTPISEIPLWVAWLLVLSVKLFSNV